VKFQVSPAARREGREAATWYNDQQPGLGHQFLDKVQTRFLEIAENPRAFARWEPYEGPLEIRGAFLGRFPYVILFAVKGESVTVLAICHAHRHPLYWMSRLD